MVFFHDDELAGYGEIMTSPRLDGSYGGSDGTNLPDDQTSRDGA